MPHLEEIKHHSTWLITKAKLTENGSISTDFIKHIETLFLGQQEFDPNTFNPYPLSEILSYLRLSHQLYLDIFWPQIETVLVDLSAHFSSQYPALTALLEFVEVYKEQLAQHIHIEEQVLFSFVDKMLNGIYSYETKKQVLEHFLFSHNDDVFIALDEIKAEIVVLHHELNDYLPFRLLFEQLDGFQQDLTVHGLIEDHVLIQKIIAYSQFHFEQS